ncbi:MAG: DUF3068 domain-containing protein [Frankiaceae bacterium]|nr:DUF3068 domain-containing protein [Frankiaceae bacterium]
MRRAVPTALIGLGAFLLALAVLLPTLVVPRLEKAPLDTYSIVFATGTGDYLNPETLKFATGEEITVTRVTRGDVEASGDDVAVYEQSQTTEVEAIDAPLDVIREKILLDRNSGIGTGGTGDRPSHEEAYTVKLPFNTKQGSYLVHDASFGEAYAVEYVGDVDLQGTKVMEFRSGPTEPAVVGQQGVPGRLLGAPDVDSIFSEEIYENLGRVIYVEPRTGAIVGGSSHPRRAFRPSLGTEGEETAIFDAELVTTEESTAELLADATDAADQLTLVGRTLPIVLGLLGLLALLAGLLVPRRRGRRERVVK